jgi:L-ascorbate metabolism protein UlaG (beta-lactamase superfamily)
MKVTFHGHSCFEIECKNQKLIIDPFLRNNPVAKISPEEIDVNYILVSHGHGDHLGDTVEIAKRTGATVITNYEIATWVGWKGVKTHAMHIGGSYVFEFGRVKLTPAWHGSTYIEEEIREIIPLGTPAGIQITLNEKTIYHAGDTGLFYDMKLIGMQTKIDLALLPIGDNFTMGPQDALVAAKWINAPKVVPMHYNTWPIIAQDGDTFVKELQEEGIDGIVMEVEDSLIL